MAKTVIPEITQNTLRLFAGRVIEDGGFTCGDSWHRFDAGKDTLDVNIWEDYETGVISAAVYRVGQFLRPLLSVTIPPKKEGKQNG